VLAIAGTPQSAMVTTAFATNLQVVVEDSGNPVGAGVNVTFALVDPTPSSPGGTFPSTPPTSVTVATDANGTATAPTFTANFHSSSPYPFVVTASVANGTPASFDLTSLPGPPAGIGPLPYTTPQAATVGTPYGQPMAATTPLQVAVRDAYQNFAGPGINVTFTAPSSGPSGTFPGGSTSVTVATDANSYATAPTFTANGTAGSYELTASVSGVSTPAVFNLLNVSHDAVINGPASGAQCFLSQAGGLGSVTYQENPNTGGWGSTLTGLTSFTWNGQGGTNIMNVILPPSGPLLPGPASFNPGAGTSYLTIGGASAPVVTQPGGIKVDGQAILYSVAGVMQFQFPSATGVNASVAPLYPPPPGAFVKGVEGIGPIVHPIPMTPSEHFVQVLYLDVLGRAGSLAEVDGWAAGLDAGASQASVAAAIEGSFEARERLVQTWYHTYLGRQAQGGEELGWVNELLTQTEERVLSQILGSPEFYQRAQTLVSSGTPDQRYLQALYQVLLGRPAFGTEVAAWEALLPSLGRQGVALGFLVSQEFRTYQIEGYYNALLHRPDVTVAVNGWVNSGLDIRSARIGFESSPEFYANG
jgi:hypothetical protein